MNRSAVIVVLAFLATLVAALAFLGVFEPAPKPPAPAPAEPRPAPTPETPILDVASSEPTNEPPVEVPAIPAPVRVLLLSDHPRSFTFWTTAAWAHEPRIEWQAWFADPASPGQVTHSPAQPALEKAPSAADVDGYDVLFVSALDAHRVQPDFWERVAARVREGRLGLLVVPDPAGGESLASEPSLRGVLPVVEVLALRGSGKTGEGMNNDRARDTIPGVLSPTRPFTVTKEGVRHPATRFVSFPGWSEQLWTRYTRGDHGWRTPFVSPVKSLAPGASVLVRVEEGEQSWPAFVASSGDTGRALWLGGILDLDWDAYRTDVGYTHLRAMAISWIAWLSPPR